MNPEDTLLFGSDRIESEWSDPRLSPTLKTIVLDAVGFGMSRLAWVFFVTCIWRSPLEDAALKGTGVHPLWRAIDVRTRDRAAGDVEALVAYLSGRWIYDPTRPTKPIIYTAEHGTGPHAHIQAHANSVRRFIIRGA
jgi:hypothetical protein